MKKTKTNDNATVHRRKNRSILTDDEFRKKVKDVVTGARVAGRVISRTMVIAIGNGIINASCPSKLKDFGGHIALTEGLARGVLRSSQASSSYSRRNLHSKDALPRLLKIMTYRRNLF